MERSTLLFVTLTLVVVFAFGAIGVGLSTIGGPESASSSCSTAVTLRTYYSPLNGSLSTDAFLMAPGSTATVCITYHFEQAGTFIPETGTLECGAFRDANGTVASGCTGEVAASSSELSFYHPDELTLTVDYTLRASGNARGVYWFWVDCGEFFPVAVGTRPASLTFPIISGCVFEPNALSAGTVVGASDLRVGLVPVG